jgi:hypothetical protein
MNNKISWIDKMGALVGAIALIYLLGQILRVIL